MTNKRVYVTTDYREKQLQRALLQFSKPENANLVREALKMAGREDLIGTSPDSLVRPAAFGKVGSATRHEKDKKHRGGAKKKTDGHSAYKPFSDALRGKTSKIERVFGKDAERILREADKMSKNNAGGSRRCKADLGKTNKNGAQKSPYSSKGQKKSENSRKK